MPLDPLSDTSSRRIRLGAAAAVAICLAGTLAGCNSAKPEEGLGFSDAEIEAMPPFQRDIFKDGVLTAAEYESAVVAQRDCVIEAGYEPSEITRSGGLLGFDTEANYGDESDPEKADQDFLASLAECESEYITYVGTAWTSSLIITDPAEFEREREGLVSCLNDIGLDVSSDASLEEIAGIMSDASVGDDQQVVAAVAACDERYGDLFIVKSG